jgi:DNA/RNA endonuclease YhcR with UshA esterase domain|tara:strand:- start:65 stop:331 length:267 start_codon:yes stop_codon:yes gene_type:complete
MVIWKPITTEANLHASTVSNIGLSRYVRLLNTSAVGTELLVTLKNVGTTTLGTFTVEGQQEVIIYKEPSDTLIGGAAVEAVGVAINGS